MLLLRMRRSCVAVLGLAMMCGSCERSRPEKHGTLTTINSRPVPPLLLIVSYPGSESIPLTQPLPGCDVDEITAAVWPTGRIVRQDTSSGDAHRYLEGRLSEGDMIRLRAMVSELVSGGHSDRIMASAWFDECVVRWDDQVFRVAEDGVRMAKPESVLRQLEEFLFSRTLEEVNVIDRSPSRRDLVSAIESR